MYKLYKVPIYLSLLSYISAVDFRLDIPFRFEVVYVFLKMYWILFYILKKLSISQLLYPRDRNYEHKKFQTLLKSG